MVEIIDLTMSPRPDIIEISSDQEDTSRCGRAQANRRRKRSKGNTLNDTCDGVAGNPAWPLIIHSPEVGKENDGSNEPTRIQFRPPPAQISSPTTDEPCAFIFDGTAAPMNMEDYSSAQEPVESNEDERKLLLPSHVAILHDDSSISTEVIPRPKPSSEDEEYIEYLDYEDHKAPGLVRYFEVAGEGSNQSKPPILKCKKCGVEGDHKTYECPVQICLTCGAHDKHSTRSCPISKTCYACGMKGHINKTCPNRFSAHMASSDLSGGCNRCRSTGHKTNECPTLWRIYQYMNDGERTVLMRSREERKQLVIGEDGEGYIGEEVWCYNCANTGHLGDDCDELPHPMNLSMGHSAFSFHNVMSGPFCNLAPEPISVKRGPNKVGRPRPLDDRNAYARADVGKQGKSKDKERLEKKFREQEDEGEDWFDNLQRRGMDQQMRPPQSREKTLKFGPFKDGGHGCSSRSPSLSTGGGGPSLLTRLSDSPRRMNDRGRYRREQLHQSEDIRIRGAAANPRNQDGKCVKLRKTDVEESQDQWDRDKPGYRGSKWGRGSRYKGGYDR